MNACEAALLNFRTEVEGDSLKFAPNIHESKIRDDRVQYQLLSARVVADDDFCPCLIRTEDLHVLPADAGPSDRPPIRIYADFTAPSLEIREGEHTLHFDCVVDHEVRSAVKLTEREVVARK